MVGGGLAGEGGGLLAGLGAGSRVAGYLLEGQVGAGGMAVVFRARDVRLERVVALKVLAPGLAADEGFRRRFIRESRAAAAVDDPHIIPVYEAGEAGGVLFIAMRFVAGGDVRSLLRRRGVLSAGRVAGIVSPVALALDAAHAAGLVHRDVKPANMLVDVRPGRPDHVYLSDFGLSKGALSVAGLTGSGQFLGTPGYSAPEQIQGRRVDGRADQYALACTAFELLCGEVVFRRDEGLAVIYAHVSEPPPLLSSRVAGVPPGWMGCWGGRWRRSRGSGLAVAGSSLMRCGTRSAWPGMVPDRVSGRGGPAARPRPRHHPPQPPGRADDRRHALCRGSRW